VLYSDQNGTPLANPFTGDSAGRYEFFVEESHYDISISRAGFATQVKSYVAIAGPTSLEAHKALTGTNVHGMGTMSTQNASDYSTTIQANSLYAPASHVTATGTNVHGLGTMSTQNSNNVGITGGTISGVYLWSTPTYSATDFAGSGGTWTVEAADVANYQGVLIGSTMIVNFYLTTTTVGNGVTALLVYLPDKTKTCAKNQVSTILAVDNNSAAIGTVSCVVGHNYLTLFKNASQSGGWSASTNLTTVSGSFVFEVQ
jgi:hypothetical protein